MKAAVITISDRAAKGVYEDKSGPEIVKVLKESVSEIEIFTRVIPDDKNEILNAFQDYAGWDFILTSGGTGIGPRDFTPEVTREYCDKELPGIAETIRALSYRETVSAMLSRGFSGMKGSTIIINFPGSVKAVRLCTRIVAPVMEHAVRMILGQGHENKNY